MEKRILTIDKSQLAANMLASLLARTHVSIVSADKIEKGLHILQEKPCMLAVINLNVLIEDFSETLKMFSEEDRFSKFPKVFCYQPDQITQAHLLAELEQSYTVELPFFPDEFSLLLEKLLDSKLPGAEGNYHE